jgi:LacI family transcriptional regulator
LSGAPQIAEKTRARVAKVADEIGYVPDRAAQRLRTGRTNVISLILDPHDELIGFGRSLISGLTKALRGSQFHLTITPRFSGDENLLPVRYILRNQLADGVLFSRTEPFDDRVRLLQEAGMPFVSHGRTAFSTPHAYVDFNNEEFAFQAAQRLIQKGRTRLCIIMPPSRLMFYQHLNFGVMRAASAAGVSVEIPDEINLLSDSEHIHDYIKQRAQQDNPPDGYICPGETTALMVMTALNDLAQKSGDEYDIVAKYTSKLFEHFRPRIDTIFEDIELAGLTMGQLLIRQIEGESAANLHAIHEPSTKFVDT